MWSWQSLLSDFCRFKNKVTCTMQLYQTSSRSAISIVSNVLQSFAWIIFSFFSRRIFFILQSFLHSSFSAIAAQVKSWSYLEQSDHKINLLDFSLEDFNANSTFSIKILPSKSMASVKTTGSTLWNKFIENSTKTRQPNHWPKIFVFLFVAEILSSKLLFSCFGLSPSLRLRDRMFLAKCVSGKNKNRKA